MVSTFSRNRRCFMTWVQFHWMQGTCKGDQSQRIFFLSLLFMWEIYVKFWCQRFLEIDEVSWPGTNSIECRGPARVANHKGNLFPTLFSCWKFRSNSGVKVFSKQARFQDMGPIPLNRGDLQGWPFIEGFLFIVNFPVENLCPILVSTFSRNRRCFMTWDQFHRMQGTCKGGQS